MFVSEKEVKTEGSSHLHKPFKYFIYLCSTETIFDNLFVQDFSCTMWSFDKRKRFASESPLFSN